MQVTIKKFIPFITAALVLVSISLAPLTMYAQTTVYQPRTQQEMLAYLYGMVAQLQLMLQYGQYCDCDSSSVQSGDLTVVTRSAKHITDDSADLVGEVESDTRQSVRVWFEYDTSRNLDERSGTTRLSLQPGVTKEVTIRIADLNDDDTYYYRFIVEDEDGEEVAGATRSFTTDEDGNRDDDDYDSGDFDLTTDATRYEIGDSIRVDYEIPSGDVSTTNWIGLYDADTSNSTSYLKWKYVDDDTDGSVTFTISNEGDYEFRLFLKNGYDVVATSRTITVE